MLKELTTENFDKELKQGLKLVEFYTPWCGYCKKEDAELSKLEKIWIGQVNGDNNRELIEKYSISAFPTFLVFKNGQEVQRLSGFKTKEFLMDTLMSYLKTY